MSATTISRSGTTPVAANLFCFVAMASWAFAFPAAELLLQSWGEVALTFVRQVIAVSVLVLIWIVADGWQQVKTADWKRGIWVGGIGFGLGALLLVVGQSMSDAVTPAIAAAMMPVVGAVLEVMFDGRKLRWHLVVGIILALSGGTLATGFTFSGGSVNTGSLLCLISVILFAWATRATTRDFPNLTAIGQTSITLAGGMIFMVVTFLIWSVSGLPGGEIGSIDARHLTILVATSVASLAFAQLLWIWGAGGLGIMLASFHMNAVPFYVMVILVIFLDGNWSNQQAVGALLVALGVMTSQGIFNRPQASVVSYTSDLRYLKT